MVRSKASKRHHASKGTRKIQNSVKAATTEPRETGYALIMPTEPDSFTCSAPLGPNELESVTSKVLLEPTTPTMLQTCIDEELIVHRIATMIQKAYLQFREVTFDAFIKRVVDKGAIIEVHDDITSTGRLNGVFAKFPDHLVTNDKDKMAILCTMCCDEPFAYMKEFLEELLGALSVEVEELAVRLETPSRKTITIYESGMVDLNNYAHTIARIKSKSSGKAWAIDVSGSQYNIHDAAHDWNAYDQKYIKFIGKNHVFGTYKQYISAVSKIEGISGFPYKVGLDAMEVFSAAVAAWKAKSGIKLSDMVVLDGDLFAKAQEELLDATKTAVAKFVLRKNYTTERMNAHRYDRLHPGAGNEKTQAAMLRFRGPPIGGGGPSMISYSQYINGGNTTRGPSGMSGFAQMFGNNTIHYYF